MGIKILKRKFLPTSSSTEEYDRDTGICTVGFYSASKDPYRVAPFPELPVPWPFETSPATDGAHEIVEAVRKEYETILEARGIQMAQARIQKLAQRGCMGSRDTLIIYTLDENSESWQVAADEIQDIVNKSCNERNSTLKVSVEISNPDLMYQDTSSIIIPNSAAHQAILEIKESVYNQVKESCGQHWNSISYHMRGPRWQEQDRKPTIMITVPPSTKDYWNRIEEQIRETIETSLSEIDVTLYLEILAGEPYLLISE